MKIHKFNQYSLYDSMANDFINSFNALIIESDKENLFKRIEKKLIADLKLDIRSIASIGVKFAALYPIVQALVKNMNISSLELTPDRIILLTISTITIIYLEEKKFKSSKEEEILTKDSKSMLEELKLMGIGNGIVKKMIKAFKSIKNIFNVIAKHLGKAVVGIIDMFAYISLLIPILNGILALIGAYNLNLDTLPGNFLGLAVGVGTIIARHGISEIVKKLKNKFPKLNTKKVLSEVEEPPVQKFSTFTKPEEKQEGELIKEQ